MDGGYINEGGQLKTKNGQKYVFNGSPSGVFISKTCVIFTAIIAILALISSVLITYYVTATSMPSQQHSCTNGQAVTGVGQIKENTNIPRLNTSKPVTLSAGFLDKPSIKTNKYDITLPPPIGDIPSSNDDVISKSFEEEDTKFKNRELHLYNGWTPLHYKIIIEPNLPTSSNNGSVLIEMERDTGYPFNPIVLDVYNISISNVRVVRAASNETSFEDEIELDFDSEYGPNNLTFVITLSNNLDEEPNLRLLLSLDFISEITDTLQGIYKTSYTNYETGKKDWMISTQFSPIDARRAFPCFDRPDKKANFTISIIRSDRTAMALSNMPVIHSSPHRYGFIKDDFATTPKMPTYLVAFIVSNLEKSHYSDMYASEIPRVEIWTRPENNEMTNYAYSMVRKFLPFYEEYFGIKNRLPKIDLVSVPDFGFSAMENWGLITFRDSSLLVPQDLEKASSSAHMERVAEVIAHELAHQWFGNLASISWWDDLWLKEGFACFLSLLALDSVHPEYQVIDTSTIYEFRESMQNDADNSSHPIVFNVNSTNDIQRIFDSISYSKATILLRMLSSIIGETAFREATQDLLKTYAYKNANRNDLWEFMTKRGHEKQTLSEDLHVKDIMTSWLEQPGYPVVTVKRYGTDIILTQERYLLPTRDPLNSAKWIIPITFETDEMHKGDSIPTHWMMPNENELVIKDIFKSDNNSNNVIYLNLNRQAYYRVNYDNESWLALKKNFNSLPRITRAQLLDDALNLARAEYLTYDIPLTFLMEIFSAIEDELLWSSIQHGTNYLIHMLQREPAYETFRAFMKFNVRPAFDRYGLNEPDNESHLQLQHRANVARLACKFNYDRCTMPAHRKYRDWMADPKTNPIKPNLKATIYCTALAEGSYQEWYFAYKQYERTTSASEKEQILSSLGCTTKPWLLSKYLNMTIDPVSGIRKQDGARAFEAVAENPIGFEIAFEFLQANIKDIAEYFGDGFSTLSSMIKSITTYMNKDYHKLQLQQFAKRAQALGLNSIKSAIELSMEQVNNNIYWRKHSYYSIKEFLEAIVSEFRINIF